MPVTVQNSVNGKVSDKVTDAPDGYPAGVYTKINNEVAALVTDADRIVFSPTEDFEYKAPLEDFQKSHQDKTR